MRNPTQISLRRRWTLGATAASLALSTMLFAPAMADTDAKRIAFLGVRLQNDNEGLEPTTEAERARMAMLQKTFEDQLTRDGYKFAPVSPATKAAIETGQPIGECGGCELEYGKQAGAEEVAWIKVQKVSNLILNLNVYMASVPDRKMTFLHSVDIRGNTDESWARSLTYLLSNYFLPSAPPRTSG